VFPRRQTPISERFWLLARRVRQAALPRPRTEDRWLESEGGWRLFTRTHVPAGLDRGVPGVLLVPGIGGTAASFERYRQPVNTRELCSLGLVVMAFDPAGRGRSWGSEAYGGPEHQGDVRAALRALAGRPDVDPDRIAIVACSLGGVSVAAALASGDRPPVRFWIDWEAPSDREIITAGGKMMDPAQGHGLADDRYWYPREPIRFVGRTKVPYLRYQAAVDHAQPGETRHALRMIKAASEGGLPWFQLNDHPRGTVPARPEWMPAGLRPARRWIHTRLRELMGLP
jgi:dienelactone hydrolase